MIEHPKYLFDVLVAHNKPNLIETAIHTEDGKKTTTTRQEGYRLVLSNNIALVTDEQLPFASNDTLTLTLEKKR